ncbi:UDP-N-acetylmuramoyl-L-alanyl-D-glutamate--2, 6-diaminopimelate ligase [Variibacter gotjawalensis]|uniref:UDP-N-acetylmuramoyl-L-alanyl-D-glutamate--2,6-diaminopimelate ligase n=1 Tax=Variibacter gotjawalensis TaxID=1333996 RepID=A0A0S3PTV2_9BRAD|nr:UDP-N-acetylmuramoyl-L-alanyl-D-glutamate--2,6-diaminopimelate ligase [Variibacter gotjawalensis]NIK49625.1 UDP-N-acetylmuramoyl-L-alanyl-D-glutamate--2,6-diaminopimelate ligase [Variibacter gotjawalensis]RZS45637.1 UDP-N-acetylmuramoylalanyl-D-glutamate--2,6-diaminopimelate ligase [Variibacter gotjawalensis]BAT59308.1 UDP-N-acetylmuramoyl-L-alanyl-D-glutamate--2, 6-diaminopimelate ligase [Variibacter gotjawalensis]
MKLKDATPPDATFDPAAAAIEVGGVSADSRTVRPGDIFVALAGNKTDGARFISAALSAGAAAVMAEQKPAELGSAAFIQVSNARRALALTASRVFPQQPATIAAVTGTSGKTSIAAFVRQIWSELGLRAASVGTVGVVAPDREVYGSLTTPDPVELARTVDELAREKVSHLIVEASSHGLDQYRLEGLRVRIAAYTNLSRDHLDYHPTMEAYLAAKLRLFTELVSADGTAVINALDEHAPQVISAARRRGLNVITTGGADSTIAVEHLTRDGFGQRIDVRYAGKQHRVALPLVGGFQVENALVAAGIVIASGGDVARTFAALGNLEGAKGRLERAGVFHDAPIFVDYAHKPGALEKTLEALRPYASRRLVVVFGCGGDRDAGKRPIMGAIAAEKADTVIVTDDNPRSEDPAAIRAAIMAAAPGATEIGDRAQAIREAIHALEAGDVLVVAGKGHETGQIVKDRVLPFSDHEAVAAALQQEKAA